MKYFRYLILTLSYCLSSTLYGYNSHEYESAIDEVVNEHGCVACHNREFKNIQNAEDLSNANFGGALVNKSQPINSKFIQVMQSGYMPKSLSPVPNQLIEEALEEIIDFELGSSEVEEIVTDTFSHIESVLDEEDPSIKLNEVIYRKCLAIMTGTFAKEDDQRLLQIKSGQVDGPTACMSLFPNIPDANGFVLTKENEVNLLNQFQGLHLNWFPGNKNIQNDVEAGVIDNEEPAFYFTYSLLSDSIPFKDALVFGASLKANRVGEDDKTIPRIKNKDFFYNNPPLVEEGRLVGLSPISDIDKSIISENQEGQLNMPALFPQSMGTASGALSNASYILASGREENSFEARKGGNNLMRKLPKSIFNDFLCLDLPVLPKKNEYTYKGEGISKLTFRNSSECMSCHWGLDRMGASFSNLKFSNSKGELETNPEAFYLDNEKKYETKSIPFIEQIQRQISLEKAKFNEMGWPSPGDSEGLYGLVNESNYDGDYDPAISLRPGNDKGFLNFIDYKGNEVNLPYNGLDGLANAISETDQFYACSVSKYLEYFTGIKLDLNSSLITGNNPSNAQQVYIDFITSQANDLKNFQNIKRVIHSIFQAPFFRFPPRSLKEDEKKKLEKDDLNCGRSL